MVVGVSGGVDSMVLLHLLRDLSGERGGRLVVAHLNHGLRGEEANRDARFVAETARKWNLACVTGREDIETQARQAKQSIQVAARDARYRFFEEVMRRYKAQWLALGHNADDVAETVMMRFLRGASVEGLRGIPMEHGRTIRPLLPFRREAILTYARAHGVPFVEDSTNRKTAYLRNRVRHALIPAIEREYQPAFARHLVRYAKYFNEIHEYLSEVCERVRDDILDDEGRISLDLFRSLPVAVQRVFLERFLLEGGWIDAPVSFDQLDKILAFAGSSAGTRRMRAGKQGWLVREYDRLYVTQDPFLNTFHPVACPVPGSADLPEIGNRLTVDILESPPERLAGTAQEAFVAGDLLDAALEVRPFRPGDRVATSAGTVKVKKLFIDRKIPARLRRLIPIVTSGERIVWVGGVCVDRRFHVTEETGRVARLRFSSPIRVR